VTRAAGHQVRALVLDGLRFSRARLEQRLRGGEPEGEGAAVLLGKGEPGLGPAAGSKGADVEEKKQTGGTGVATGVVVEQRDESVHPSQAPIRVVLGAVAAAANGNADDGNSSDDDDLVE
jgi:hypothetical protein